MSRFTAINLFVLFVAVLLAVFLVSCDKSPAVPTPPPTTTIPGQVVTIQSIRIDGPAVVPPGSSAQYMATGQLPDGTTRDVTETVTWRSSDSDVLAISSTGAASGRKAGQAVIAAEESGRRAGLEVLVLAPGTFRLTGTVSEAGLPVANATVDLLDGSRAVMSTQTDSNGIYRLFGVAGDIEVRVTIQGYVQQVNRLSVSDNANSDFALTPTARTDLAGRYQLTITAGSQCASGVRGLPEEARVRTYAATIAQESTRLRIVLDGAPLISGNFEGRVTPGSVTFDIRGIDINYYYYFAKTLDLVEHWSPTSDLIISGTVTATPAPVTIAGKLDGLVGILKSPRAGWPDFTSVCTGQHRFVLARQ